MTADRGALARTGVVAAGRPLEIACDESGHEGEHLIRGNTDVFAHASVQLGAEAARTCIQEIRDRIRSPATEYKANHLLRERHRPALLWLLGPSGPLRGNAHVHLTDKTFFVLGRLVDLFVGEVGYAASTPLSQDARARAMTLTLYLEGPAAYGHERWQSFLEAANLLVRTKNRWGEKNPADSFFRELDVLLLTGTRGRVGEVLTQLRHARPRADAFREQLLDDRKLFPSLDPLIPAIFQAVVYWSEGGHPVSVVHDEQSALTEGRIAQLREMFGAPDGSEPDASPRARLTEFRLVDSRTDARVQLADFLAGVARRITSDELNDHGDAELTSLLRPYVDSSSIWGDDRSWALIGPTGLDTARGPS